MSDLETRVRSAANALHGAIMEARAAGYRVELPHQVDGLPAIAVSETARVGRAALPVPGDEYDAMTKSALIELATARGHEIPSSFTKAEVISALKAGPPAAVGA